jgi:hypothetical protein
MQFRDPILGKKDRKPEVSLAPSEKQSVDWDLNTRDITPNENAFGWNELC